MEIDSQCEEHVGVDCITLIENDEKIQSFEEITNNSKIAWQSVIPCEASTRAMPERLRKRLDSYKKSDCAHDSNEIDKKLCAASIRKQKFLEERMQAAEQYCKERCEKYQRILQKLISLKNSNAPKSQQSERAFNARSEMRPPKPQQFPKKDTEYFEIQFENFFGVSSDLNQTNHQTKKLQSEKKKSFSELPERLKTRLFEVSNKFHKVFRDQCFQEKFVNFERMKKESREKRFGNFQKFYINCLQQSSDDCERELKMEQKRQRLYARLVAQNKRFHKYCETENDTLDENSALATLEAKQEKAAQLRQQCLNNRLRRQQECAERCFRLNIAMQMADKQERARKLRSRGIEAPAPFTNTEARKMLKLIEKDVGDVYSEIERDKRRFFS